ncbi:lysoplasmalogenase [Tsukamurella strandjordii]|uniref:Lysoplasmalogenase n=1 Tax=Tsukamurella strandjordii TaxID=147577 RepID=A0AA90NMM7_9ACTN|nr:lysoplasmalogenase [Tsukamurella strandjordii]MDP0397264.1 lysoplasmalogenase [Tsukamurella strandjordii]
MSISTVLKLAYAGLATVDTALSASAKPSRHHARRFTKPLLMPVLAASLATDPRAKTSPLRTSTLAGQAAGWAGDVALLGDEPRHFALGASCFATGHAAYVSGLLRQRGPEVSLARPAAVGALWAVGAPRTVLGAYRTAPALAPVLAGYSAMLSGTAAAATLLDPAIPADARRATLAGAGLFLLSDSILGLRKFGLSEPPAWLEGAVMATYTGAQFLIAEGAARAGLDSHTV